MLKILHALILKHILQNATCFGLIKSCIWKSLSVEAKTLKTAAAAL